MDKFDSSVFWNNVKKRLKDVGYTQDELSFLAGVNIGTLRNQMSRNIMPDISEAYNIAKILECSIEYLITGVEPLEKIPEDLQAVINKYAN